MQKLLIFLFFGVAIAFYAYANPKADFNSDSKNGIQFHKGSWEEALQAAKKEHKLIFLDIYATWCGPCKLLKMHTFSNAEVGKLYNQNFVNVSLDGEKGDGAMLADKYAIRGYPSLLFIDGDGNIVGQTTGYYSPKEFIKIGHSILKN
ncbi:thioredoxin family protein [Elizabethkingia miricola]|uniref:Thioredoxin family protein n=2 Tax=Elizabethkingia TaxID=308865 RepID=A0ABD5B818_ELIMR|nr:thioredoxin family protein [Elizabethkingia miricola]MBS1740482.1 thioredoxin family protein [Bacteroidota bacterium]MDQ8750062.1 thioredoxin family protein [Elizabethkingia miricola]MDV3663238.1 thioredoxin [Elizabethkingia anophelis]